MQDRYLFRGKRLDNGEWVVGFYYSVDTSNIHCLKVNNGVLISNVYIVDFATIGQCTGLYAAKSYRGESEANRLVFEGDVVRHDGNSYEIFYMQKYAAFALKGLDYGMVLAWEYLSEFEIIGTIHDSTEGEI